MGGDAHRSFSFLGSHTVSSFLSRKQKKSTTWISKHVRPLNIQLGILLYWPLHICCSIAASVDINKKQSKSFTAPTPQNTPINPAPITSEYRPSISSISEENNQGMLSAVVKGMAISLWRGFGCIRERGRVRDRRERVRMCLCEDIGSRWVCVKEIAKDDKF